LACRRSKAIISAACVAADKLIICFAADRFSHATISGGNVTSSLGLFLFVAIYSLSSVVPGCRSE
jgi:hypothetical protein